MSFRPDKSLTARHPGWRVSGRRVILVISLLALGLFGSGLIRDGLEAPILKLAYPWLAFNRAWSESRLSWGEYLTEQRRLAADNLALRSENRELKLKLLAAERIADDYRHLRSTLGERATAPQGVVAQVLSGPGRSPFDILLLDLGRDNSAPPVVLGSLVLSHDVLLGQVVAVNDKISKVQLFSSAGVELPVVIGPEKVPATAVGRGGGNFAAYLPRGVTVALGDLVTVPAFGGRLLATVGSVDNDPEEPLQTIYLKSPVNLFTLTWVEIYAR